MTPAERRDYLKQRVLTAKRRRKMSKAERITKQRKAVKNRKRRKYRSRIFKSRRGMKARGIDGKVIRKRFFVVTYDANGNTLGTLWFSTPKPTEAAQTEHLAQHGIKHPMLLPVISPEKLKSMKHRLNSSKQAKNRRRRG